MCLRPAIYPEAPMQEGVPVKGLQYLEISTRGFFELPPSKCLLDTTGVCEWLRNPSPSKSQPPRELQKNLRNPGSLTKAIFPAWRIHPQRNYEDNLNRRMSILLLGGKSYHGVD